MSVLITSGTATASTLKALADSLSAGEWGELEDFTGESAIGTATQHIFQFADNAVFDGHTSTWWMYGGQDGGGSYRAELVSYSEAANAFVLESRPSWQPTEPASPRHSYRQNVHAPERREMFYNTMVNNGDWYKFDLDTETWTTVGGYPNTGSEATATAWFPARGKFVAFTNASLAEFDPEAGTWAYNVVSFSQFQLSAGIIYSNVRISGFSGPGCCVLYDKTGRCERYDQDGTLTTLDSYTGNGNLDTEAAHVSMDPVSGKIVVMITNRVSSWGGTQQAWELDPSASAGSQWTRLNSGTYANVESGGCFVDSTQMSGHMSHHGASCEIPTHGVLMYVQQRSVGTRVFVYKHSDSMTPDEVAADSDTLNVLDFETALRGDANDEYFIGIDGASKGGLNDTTDPNRYFRDHAVNSWGGSGLSMQVSGDPWRSSFYQTVSPHNGDGVYESPKRVDSVGEFENVTGASGHSCMKFQIRSGMDQTGSGDLVVAFQRTPLPPSTNAPFSFETAGTGAEFWVRFAIKQNAAMIETEQTSSGAKRILIHGDYSSQSLEETLATITPHTYGNARMQMYSNAGTEPYPAPSPVREYVEDWTVFHIRVIVGDDNTSNGTVELYINEETTPVIQTTTSNMDGDPLGTGWNTIDTSVSGTNQGYWRCTFTLFSTNKDTSQSHDDMIAWYDNIVIRKDTRCPPLRSG
jgi:hypothetical protein